MRLQPRSLLSLRTQKCTCGCPELDALLRGGVPCGAITELCGAASEQIVMLIFDVWYFKAAHESTLYTSVLLTGAEVFEALCKRSLAQPETACLHKGNTLPQIG